MVIIRESPRKQQSQTDKAWPPRSPLDALLSSPSGRKRYEDRSRNRSISPSPAKRRRIDSDDEETLQLELQRIEAKIRLKRLQKAKGKDYQGPASSSGSSSSIPAVANRIAPSTIPQVPMSPTRPILQRESVQKSPARVLLGIDKGLRAQDVSLKRVSKPRRQLANQSSSSATEPAVPPRTVLPIKSFAQRMLECRSLDQERGEKITRIANSRSKGFSLEDSKDVIPTPKKTPPPPPIASSSAQPEPNPQADSPLEPYSGFHIRNRKIGHSSLTRSFNGKQLYSLPRLLKEVKSPDYEPPDCESDYVVFAILASKSSPLDHKTSRNVVQDGGTTEQQPQQVPRFMVIRLTDLRWEISLYLFDTGFETFFKLTPGTVVAILNPGIMPPKPGLRDSGAFSLKLASSEDTVLEIGTAADLGFCKATKADGHECRQWVDARKTAFCEYHVSLRVDKARRGRMEFNTMVGGATQGGAAAKGGKGGGATATAARNARLKAEGKTYDQALHETLYLAPRELGFSATRLLDSHDPDVNAWQRGCSKEEWARRRTASQQRERELARKLSSLGSGAGRDYLGRTAQEKDSDIAAAVAEGSIVPPPPPPVDAESLGLLGKRADSVSLSAADEVGRKRKRSRSGNVAEPVGWGGANRRGLPDTKPRPLPSSTIAESAAAAVAGGSINSILKEPGQPSPRKNARFMLDKKGIRLPGRESLGAAANGHGDDDSDDDLEII